MANPVSRFVSWVRKAVLGSRKAANSDSRNARASALRPYLAGDMPGLWASNHTEEANHFTGWNYCAITAKAEQAAQAEVAVYHITSEPGRFPKRITKSVSGEQQHDDRIRMDDKHPLVRLMNRPNPGQSGARFRYMVALQMCLTGSALVWFVKNHEGVPVELYVIPTGATTPLPPNSEYPLGAYRVAPLASFAVTMDDDFLFPGSLGPLLTVGGVIDARNVKAIRWPHSLYLSDGWSPLAAGSLVIDVAEQLDRSRWSQFKNAINPGMVLKQSEDVNAPPEEMEAFRQDLRARNSGTANTGKDLLLPPGIEPERVESTPREMDYTTSFTQVRDAVLALHKTPAVAVGVAEAGSYSAYYASLKQFVELSVQPMLDLMAEELTEALGPAFERVDGLSSDDRLLISFQAKAIDDPSLLEQRLSNDRSAMAITINEWRALRGMEPVDWGDCPVGQDPFEWERKKQQAKNPQAAMDMMGMMGGGVGAPGAPTDDAAGGLAALLGGGGAAEGAGGDVTEEADAEVPGEESDEPTLGEILAQMGEDDPLDQADPTNFESDDLGDPLEPTSSDVTVEPPEIASDFDTGISNPAKEAVPGRPVTRKRLRQLLRRSGRPALRKAVQLVTRSRWPDSKRLQVMLWLANEALETGEQNR